MAKSQKSLKLYSWNVNGIRAVSKKGSLTEFFDRHDPDIFCLQEIKANEEQIADEATILETFSKYNFYFNSATKKGYSGTAIFSKVEPINVINDIPQKIASKYNLEDKYGDTNKEGRIIACEFAAYYLITMYTPNVKNTLERLELRKNWDNAILEYVKKLEKKKPVLFCGDLNVAHNEIDLARPKPNVGKAGFTESERSAMQTYIDNGYVDTFRFLYPDKKDIYSWWSARGCARDKNVGWRIDYWLSSSSLKNKIVEAKIHTDVFGSDHCPVSLTLAMD